ncbi:MAG TPA: SPOR domain-containing protein [Gammaproteobacteria bacterium]|nr:SPOR domain-containing protein [Gammaproteobacteria bacterium]
MAARGRSRRRRKDSRKEALQALVWFIIGLGLGLAVLLPLLFGGDGGGESPEPPADQPAPSRSQSAPASQADRPESSAAPAAEPPEQSAGTGGGTATSRPADSGDAGGERRTGRDKRDEVDGYRFYTLLPKMEVQVPGGDGDGSGGEQGRADGEGRAASAPQPQPQSGETPEARSGGRFLVQVAAFRTRKAAEKLKARLALKGLQARVVSADLDAKGTWHRVRLGPYSGRADAERIRDRLEGDGMRGMILRR